MTLPNRLGRKEEVAGCKGGVGRAVRVAVGRHDWGDDEGRDEEEEEKAGVKAAEPLHDSV